MNALVELNVNAAGALDKSADAESGSAMTMMIIAVIIAIIAGIALALYLSRSITGPIDDVKRNLREMSLGHLGNRMKSNRKDEIGEMAATMDQFSEDLQTNIVGSLKRVAAGDLTVMMAPKDAQDEITPAIMATVTSLNGLVDESKVLIKATVDGKLDTRGNADKFQGGYKDIVLGVNKLIDAFVAPINVTAEYVDRISKGDIPPKITDTYNGDFNEIKNNLNACIDVMNGLLPETNTLIQATQDGKLQTRGNAQQFAGGWGELVGGVNKLIDAFVAPINVTAEYVDRISKGDIPPKITDTYNGDFNEIKNNLNACIDVMNGLLPETDNADPGDPGRQAADARQRPAVRRRLGRAGRRREQADRRLRGPDQRDGRVRGPDLQGRHPAEDHRHLQRRLQRDQEQPQRCIDVMNGLLQETTTLIQATQDGKLADARQRAAVRRRLGRAGRRRQQADRRLRGPDQRDRRVRGPDLQGRHPAEDHRHLQRRLQRDQEQPQRLHRRDERPAHGDRQR